MKNLRFILVSCFFISFFMGGCVTNNRLQKEITENKVLSSQLQEEKQRRINLETTVTELKKRIKTLKSNLAASKTQAKKKLEELKDHLSSLKNAFTFSKEMKEKIEKTFDGKFDGLKEEYEKGLKKARQKILMFQNRLKKPDEDLLKLKREITKKIDELVALKDKIDLFQE